jgi:hypothetical protein
MDRLLGSYYVLRSMRIDPNHIEVIGDMNNYADSFSVMRNPTCVSLGNSFNT